MRRRRNHLLVAATALLALAGALASPAWAQESDIPGVEITPSKFMHDLEGRDFALKIMVVNHDPVAHAMDLYITGLGHDLDGSPRFIDPAKERNAISLPVPQLVLGPGGRQELVLRGSIPAGRRSLYAAVVAEFQPPGEEATQLQVRSRVAGMFLLRGPKPWIKKVDVEDVGLLPAEEGVTVYAALENTGNVHVSPHGRVRIYKDDVLLDTVPLPGQIVIPGFARRLVGAWVPPRNLDGPVRLETDIFGPEGHGSATIYFANGDAVIPSAEITNLYAHSEDGHTEVVTLVTNTGETPLDLDLGIKASEEGAVVRTERTVADLQPGESREVIWTPELDDGLYLIKARATVDGKVLDESVTGVEVTSAFNWLLVIAILSLLANAYLLERLRRSRKARRSMVAVAEDAVSERLAA
ncbi:MAG TPA: hypothetical protein VHJ82_06335 [Actinomycetota bacterium]|nr:hypothetical protein [Actinomycetota bacterium]